MANSTIADQIARIKANILAAYDAVQQKGGTVPPSNGGGQLSKLVKRFISQFNTVASCRNIVSYCM